MLYFASASIQTEATAVTLKSMQTKKPSSTTRDHANAPLLLSNKKRGPVVRFQHSHSAAATPFANVGTQRTTSNYKFLVEFWDLTFGCRALGWRVPNVKSTPLGKESRAVPIRIKQEPS
jgi:hypothetical protein